MIELEEFERNARELQRQRGSVRKALQDGRLRAVEMPLPKVSEITRRDTAECSTTIKVTVIVIMLSIITMLCYAVWRIRIIEQESEAREDDYDYRIITAEEFATTANNNVDVT